MKHIDNAESRAASHWESAKYFYRTMCAVWRMADYWRDRYHEELVGRHAAESRAYALDRQLDKVHRELAENSAEIGLLRQERDQLREDVAEKAVLRAMADRLGVDWRDPETPTLATREHVYFDGATPVVASEEAPKPVVPRAGPTPVYVSTGSGYARLGYIDPGAANRIQEDGDGLSLEFTPAPEDAAQVRDLFDGAPEAGTPEFDESEPWHPAGIQPGDRVMVGAAPNLRKGTVVDKEPPMSVRPNSIPVELDPDSGGALVFARPEATRRIYTADSPEPPADVTVLRDLGDTHGVPFLAREGNGWGWGETPPEAVALFGSWGRFASDADGVLVEYREGDPT